MDGAMAQLLQPLSILEKMMKETDFMKCALQRFKGRLHVLSFLLHTILYISYESNAGLSSCSSLGDK